MQLYLSTQRESRPQRILYKGPRTSGLGGPRTMRDINFVIKYKNNPRTNVQRNPEFQPNRTTVLHFRLQRIAYTLDPHPVCTCLSTYEKELIINSKTTLATLLCWRIQLDHKNGKAIFQTN